MRVLLAGGAGGLGSTTAELLASEGWELIVTYLSNAQRAAQLSPIARVVQADITSAADRRRLLLDASPLNGLVVFAGNPARVASADRIEEQMRTSHEANYLGPLLLARETAEFMKSAGEPGSIVLFSTMQGVALFPGSTAYAGAKAALIHGARLLAKEMRGKANIRVNVIAPGIIDAGMAQPSIEAGKYNRYLTDDTIPRFGRPQDIARTVRFLLEPDNYITGQVIGVDGGITL
jgi:NAD(P)-dependent dehydrogenase (short-subunit alcohol dehydrogenase family)